MMTSLFARTMRGPSVLVLPIAAHMLAVESSAAQQRLPMPPLVLDVPTPPRPFTRDGRVNLTYELHVTNLGAAVLIIDRVEALDERGAIVESVEGSALENVLARPVPALKLIDARMVEPGRRAVVFFWYTPRGRGVPPRVHHRVTARTLGGAQYEANAVTGADVAVSNAPALVLSPPLRGGRWVARFSGNDDSHRRTLMALSGRPRIAQRFAIDFGLLGPDGRQFTPNGSTNADMYGYDADVLAVGAGRVVTAVDGVVENDPNLPQPQPGTLAAAFGNHVILSLGNGAYAFYAHLRPGTIAVRLGQRVNSGEVIAHVGNTGAATGPHLHFQVMDSRDLLVADGLPYVIDRFEMLGTESIQQFQATVWSAPVGATWRTIRNEMPGDAAVIRFPLGARREPSRATQ